MWRILDRQFLRSPWFHTRRGQAPLKSLRVHHLRQTQQGLRGVAWLVTRSPQVKTLKL